MPLPRSILLALLCCCAGGGRAAPARPRPGHGSADLPGDRSFRIDYRGHAIGAAHETWRATASGLVLRRSERYHFKRNGQITRMQVDIEIDCDAQLHARTVRVAHHSGGEARLEHARRLRDGRWRVTTAGGVRALDAEFVPVELVDALVARSRDRAFDGRVFLSSQGFEPVPLRVQPNPDGTRAILVDGSIRSTATLDEWGRLGHLRGPGHHSLVAIDKPLDEDALGQVDLLESITLAVDGADAGGHTLVFSKVAGPPPAGARALDAQSWQLSFEPDEVPGLWREALTELAERADREVIDDLSAEVNLDGMLRGDCNAHAVHFAHLARDAGLKVRIATGFRFEDGRLARHRWAQVEVEGRWLSIDPSFGEVAPRRRLLLLTTHGEPFEQFARANLVFLLLADARAELR